jgi:sugar phosphate isomerase/epimerase
MALLVSSLIRGMNEMEQVAREVNDFHKPNVGVELIAFTHDAAYWQRLTGVLAKLQCPRTFHGPYIKTEGTSADGTPEQEFLYSSYDKTVALAKANHVLHIVYHVTQLTFTEQKQADALRPQAEKNAEFVIKQGVQAGVPVLIENLCYPQGRLPLYSNKQYFDFFARYPQAYSIIDIGHAHVTGLDLEKFLATHGKRIKAYHFHNNHGLKDEHNDIFDGTFNFEKFATLYKQYTPKANIVLEYEPHVNLSQAQLKEQIDFVLKTYNL